MCVCVCVRHQAAPGIKLEQLVGGFTYNEVIDFRLMDGDLLLGKAVDDDFNDDGIYTSDLLSIKVICSEVVDSEAIDGDK